MFETRNTFVIIIIPIIGMRGGEQVFISLLFFIGEGGGNKSKQTSATIFFLRVGEQDFT